MNILNQVKLLLNCPSLVLEHEVQSLWSGYGQIIRCKNSVNNQSYIVKVISPKQATSHPRGWNTSVSHQRKILSYQIEAIFYKDYAPLTDAHNKVPKLIASSISEHCTLLIMEDLDQAGYFVRKQQADWSSLSSAIKWLAFFHGKFIHNNATNLWEVGTYWHLATRQDEWSTMPVSNYKKHAHHIDYALNNAQYQTLVHGDAKFENLCFHQDGKAIAAVDFQYVGRGSAVKDLAYLAASCLDNDGLLKYDEFIVTEYLNQLKSALAYYQNPVNFKALSTEFIALYPVAWADFYRFLLGWNPQSPKISDYMIAKSDQGLKIIINR